MILVSGGVKGGAGKSTLAVNLAIMRSLAGKDVLLVDADDQESASDFSLLREDSKEGGTGYTAIKLHGKAVKTELLKIKDKHDDIVIDVGGRDTSGQRAALLVADLCVVPFAPSSFDVWALDKLAELVDNARDFNEQLKVICLLNRADPGNASKDNAEAVGITKDYPQLEYLDCPIVNRKAFRRAADRGVSVVELQRREKDPKAIAEIQKLYDAIYPSE